MGADMGLVADEIAKTNQQERVVLIKGQGADWVAVLRAGRGAEHGGTRPLRL